MKKRFIIIATLSMLSLWCCNTSPKSIDYGHDSCQFCKMTIVDKVHGAELVTRKGKVYKFDASECMINFLKTVNTSEIKHYLTNTYDNPEALFDAQKATFLISQKIPSPMGAFLTAFESRTAAENAKHTHGGICYTWDELQTHLNNTQN